MKPDFPKPKKGAVFYSDSKLYATLANFPKTKGHVVIVWKKKVTDLHLLTRKEYLHLMDVVEKVRSAMLNVLKINKVYLIYMDETKHVHWHLIPRYAKMGYNLLKEKPKELKHTTLALKFKQEMKR